MRPNLDVYFMRIAWLVASRSTCLRRAVGCVLIDVHGHVMATGYNGVAAGQLHCNEGVLDPYSDNGGVLYPHACPGARAQTGTQLDACNAIHAEQNALLQCRDVHAIVTCYCTALPCVTCVKLLLNTNCGRICFDEDYPTHRSQVLDLWRRRELDRVTP